jgi:hypothetical protein
MENRLGFNIHCQLQFKHQSNAEKVYYKYSEEIAQRAISSRYSHFVFFSLFNPGFNCFVYDKFTFEFTDELQNSFWTSLDSICNHSLCQNY